MAAEDQRVENVVRGDDVWGPLLLWAPFVLTPSLQVFQEVATRWVIAYLVVACLGIAAAWRLRRPILRVLDRLSDSAALALAAAVLVLLIAAFCIGNPRANARNAAGGGSDQEESINLAVNAIWDGEHPYYPLTYLGNPASVMPGSLLLAMPFVALGNSAYQNLFWLMMLPWATRRVLPSAGVSLSQLVAILGLSPVVLHSLVTGSDLLANSLFVLIAMFAAVHSVGDARGSIPGKLAAAIFLGVAMSSRTNFLLLLPILIRFLIERAGWRSATIWLAFAGGVFAALTVPFAMYDFDAFGPWVKQDKFVIFRHVLPHVDLWAPAIAAAIALGLAVTPGKLRESQFWRRCAIIQMFPVAAIVALAMADKRWIDLHWTIYGQVYLFFGSLAFWMEIQPLSASPQSLHLPRS